MAVFGINSVKPMKYYKGYQEEARLYEYPKKTEGRNPPGWCSTYSAEYNRRISPMEYTGPEYPQSGLVSKSIVFTPPGCPYNTHTPPHTLDYLPMPWNMSKTSNDPRLISGYKL